VSPRRSCAFTISSRDSFDGKNQRGLAGAAKGLDPVEEPRPDLVVDLAWEVAGVDALLVRDVRRERLPQVFRQALGFRRLPGHQRVRLDVEGEVGWRSLEPQLALPARGERVVRRVDLDDRELVRVIDEPVLRGVRVGRVEDAGRGHRRVGP
jgi:hypothetical protein